MNSITVLEVRSVKYMSRAVFLAEALRENLFLCLLEAACVPRLLAPQLLQPLLLSSHLLLTLTSLKKTLVIILSLQDNFPILKPWITSAKSLLPSEVTYPQVLGILGDHYCAYHRNTEVALPNNLLIKWLNLVDSNPASFIHSFIRSINSYWAPLTCSGHTAVNKTLSLPSRMHILLGEDKMASE